MATSFGSMRRRELYPWISTTPSWRSGASCGSRGAMTTSPVRCGAMRRRSAMQKRVRSRIRAPRQRRMSMRIFEIARRAVVLVALSAALAPLAGCGVNNIPNYQEQAKAAWAQVLNQYQRRADLVPNLVNTVKGAANFETKTLQAVVEARAKVGQTQLPSDILTNPQAMRTFEQNQAALTSALSRLLVVVE